MLIDLNERGGDLPSLLEDDNETLRGYVINPQIPIHDPQLDFIPRTANLHRLFHVPSGLPGQALVPERCPDTGVILDFVEVAIQDVGSTARNSMSLQRAPGRSDEATRGSANNYPFWPGGFDEPEDKIKSLKIDNYDFENNLLSIAPGFSSGVEFTTVKTGTSKEPTKIESNEKVTIDLLSLVAQENDILGMWDDAVPIVVTPDVVEDESEKIIYTETIDDSLLDTTTNESQSILEISKVETIQSKAEWAEMIDISQPVTDFDKLIPDLAHQYPFELDPFQKQAILKLEEHNHVFVAAHTSAGKTVVAEYAIALSQKHMTKTIYTSPIKALSNQKYRDFKKVFKDVGLITGDIQIDPAASCLIMTTEILRSMLYCGSDITRDLEYVIFDEVHYITDAERGYVWEEVLILLPDHVSIVMLSATVPNTLEFANWVGRTKRRKVYVISTLKRPVPLKHYLYTGCGGKSRDEIFLLVDENSKFLMKGYKDAVEAKKSRKKENYRDKTGPKQEVTMWSGLIDHLKKNQKLPVVAFTLSRNRCESNANALRSTDLCTQREKNLVHLFFQKCLQKLKPPDRNLPQVLNMEDCLKRGIGVHHSGILPILKEIVEMLFQNGFVKLLFATETFAMGVNMPARTVIFDNTKKFDGQESRILRPAEYIQMAGRAGRRGLDDNGTVILICKHDVPADSELKEMMLGRPMQLISQFRLTYAMILNLLRVENVTVEDMMSHSFREFDTQLKKQENKLELKAAEDEILTLQDLSEHLQPLCTFYNVAYNFILESNFIMGFLVTQYKIGNELKPGRILKVTHQRHYNKIGVLLAAQWKSNKDPVFKVLVLDHVVSSSDLTADELMTFQTNRGELWHRMMALAPQNQQFIPEGIGGHSVLNVKPTDIVEITQTNMKLEFDLILQNWDQRQIPRFRDSPPGQSVVKAVSELNNLNEAVNSGKTVLKYVDLKQGLDVRAQQVLTSWEHFNHYKEKLKTVTLCTNIANFEQEFAMVFDRKILEMKKDDLLFKLSNKSLSLYPDYCNKLNVLQELNYIDSQHQVSMKGKVACEMGSNELMITELILGNVLTDLDPAEIAALLSSLVFQAKTDVEIKPITDSLVASRIQIETIDQSISNVEKKYNVCHFDSLQAKDRLNFGLMEVVYEWANNKPFADIMKLTDIQEGIIVRCIQQLHETLRDVKDAARLIGNPGLQNKMEEATNAIKRDIVFAASLYTQKDSVSVGID